MCVRNWAYVCVHVCFKQNWYMNENPYEKTGDDLWEVCIYVRQLLCVYALS